jgi:hypothetical protein
MPRHVELHGFAERVERVCDFFLAQLDRNGSQDVKVIEDLKADAIEIQANAPPAFIEGLNDYMSGLPPKEQ